MKLGLLFPGQGTLTTGMGRGLVHADPAVRRSLDAAGARWGFDVERLGRDGPAPELVSTARAQLVVTAWNLALLAALDPPPGRVVAVAGHSAGELSALAGAGALDPGDVLDLAAERTQAMVAAGAGGGMLAVVGPTVADVARALPPADAPALAVVNGPTSVVLSGDEAELDAATEALRPTGARCRRLAVGGPYHSRHMAPAVPAWRAAVERAPLRPPAAAIVSGARPVPTGDPAVVRRNLTDAITAPVRWLDALDAVVACGVTDVAEVGCSHVFRGLVRRRHPDVRYWTMDDVHHVLELRERARRVEVAT